MAMRMFSADELASELIRRGCEKVRDNEDGSQLWRRDDGRHFLVPEPEIMLTDEDQESGSSERAGYYPDWMLDDLIDQHDLPRTPIRPH